MCENMYKSWLWTNRMKWVGKKPKFRGCLFCRMIKGDKKIPSKILYKNKKVMIIMNLFPYNTGHIQVIPVRHVTWPDELTDNEFYELFMTVKKCIEILKRILKPLGFNIGINLGDVSGASIDHLHIHIVPRFKTDFGFMEITARTKVMPESVEKTYKKLLRHFKTMS